MAKVKLLFISLIGFSFFANAQDSTKPESPKPVISGSLDVYYRFNFADSKTSQNNLTAFTNSQNSFELGMASIRADHSFGKASVTVDLGFGRRAQEFSYTDGNTNTFLSLANVKQAYLSYAFSDKFKLTMGKWATHIGYELADAYLNRNYSMSYMFSYGPFSNTGLKADVSLGGKTALMVGISNPSDYATTNSSRKWAIAQLSTATADSKWKFYLNYQGGKYDFGSNLNQFDVVVTGAITDKFGIGYNGTIQLRKPEGSSAKNWWGSAIYLNADPSSFFGLTLRAEYFQDKDGIITSAGGNFIETTLSGNIHEGKLTIIPELRLDNSSHDAFEKKNGDLTGSTFSAILAATYSF